MRNWLFIKFGGLIFGPKIFFGFVGNPTSLVKVHGKKKNSDCRFIQWDIYKM